MGWRDWARSTGARKSHHAVSRKICPRARNGAIPSGHISRMIGVVMLVLSGAAVGGIAADPPREDSPKTVPATLGRSIDFARDVRPLFETSCYACHNADKHK